MGGIDQVGANGLAQERLHLPFQCQVDQRRATGHQTMDALQVAAASEAHPFINGGANLACQGHPEQPDGIPGFAPGQAPQLGQIVHQAHHAHHRRGLDGLHGAIGQAGFVVQRDVATGNGGIQLPAGLGEAPAGHRQLPVTGGRFRRGEVEIVGNRQGLSADAAEVAGSFSHRRHGPPLGVEGHPAVGAIHHGCHATARCRHGALPLLGPQPHHGRIGTARGHHGVDLHLVVVLAIHPSLRSDGGVV